MSQAAHGDQSRVIVYWWQETDVTDHIDYVVMTRLADPQGTPRVESGALRVVGGGDKGSSSYCLILIVLFQQNIFPTMIQVLCWKSVYVQYYKLIDLYEITRSL